MKLVDPESLYVLRGNHESIEMNNNYGFRKEVLRKYDVEVFQVSVCIYILHVFTSYVCMYIYIWVSPNYDLEVWSFWVTCMYVLCNLSILYVYVCGMSTSQKYLCLSIAIEDNEGKIPFYGSYVSHS